MSAGVSRRHRCGGINLVDLPNPTVLANTPFSFRAAVRPLGEAVRWCVTQAGTPPPPDFSSVWSAPVVSDPASGIASWTLNVPANPAPILHVALAKNIYNRTHAILQPIV
jgi:hypothetical protein